MKRLVLLLASLLLAFPAMAQLPGSEIAVGKTPIVGGTNSLCLYQTNGKVGEQACGTGTATDIKVGTTTVSSGTTTRILYDNAGTLGEYTISGSGTVVAMQTAPTFLTSITHGAGPAILTSPSAANTKLGDVAVDTAPVAQTLSVQNVLAGGTSNVAGADFTIAGSQGKGTGAGGKVRVLLAPAGSSGTTVNGTSAYAVFSTNGLTLGSGSTGQTILSFTASDASSSAISNIAASTNDTVWFNRNNGNRNLTVYYSGDLGTGTAASLATNATAGFLLIPGGAGPPSGTPGNTGGGKTALYVDETNNQLYLYVNGGWKQPKTPAGAATVTWQ